MAYKILTYVKLTENATSEYMPSNNYVVRCSARDFKQDIFDKSITVSPGYNLIVIEALNDYCGQIDKVIEAYKTTYGDEYTSFPYLGDCWFSDIVYLQGIFPNEIENSTTAHEMNSFTGGYKFIFNGQKYALSFNDNYMIYDGSPCTTPGTVSIALFIPIWTKIS